MTSAMLAGGQLTGGSRQTLLGDPLLQMSSSNSPHTSMCEAIQSDVLAAGAAD